MQKIEIFSSNKNKIDFWDDMLNWLKDDFAKVNNVIINQINIKNTGPLLYEDNLARIENIPFVKEKIELNATGNFLDIGLFLEKIIKDAKNLNLNKCDFVLDEKNDRQVKASLEFYTYYIEKI